ncbi:MAG: BMC domain-containing protein [Chitinivibrionales bacterium]|nr:BMC domain-containing protein [Chitinivibrionales bacterium]
MAKQAIGMIETKGLTALVCGTDAMCKTATVELSGWKKAGSGLCSCYIAGEVAAVKAAIDAGAMAAGAVGEVVNAQVLPRPHDDVFVMLS